MKAKDHTGKKLGRLTVIEFIGSIKKGDRKRRYYKCQCECGGFTTISSDVISSEITNSCGCLHAESTRMINFKHGEANITKENRTWQHIISRCECPTNSKYKNYGGRGIKVCSRWRNSYESFLSDMGRAPTKNHSIERIDVNGDYSPENCKWATNLEQSNNKTTNIMVELNGEKFTLSQLARLYNIPYKALHRKFRYGSKDIQSILSEYGNV